MPPPGLTPEQLSSFHKDGYLIVRNALRPETVASLLAETQSLLGNLSLEDHPLTRFSTGQTSEHVGDDYFLTSGDKIRFFLEEDAFDAAGNLCKTKEKAVNKIGHGLHVSSQPFARLIGSGSGAGDEQEEEQEEQEEKEEVSPAAVARSLGYVDPRCLQSMVILKQPGIGAAVPPHQDSTFLYTDPPSATGFWYALEDATLENGCLSFLPGSHEWAGVEKRLVRKKGGAGTEMVDNEGGSKFPRGGGRRGGDGGARRGRDLDGHYVPGEVKAGDLVLIHGNLLHKSERNTSAKGRIIYTFHIIEGEDREYDERNWLQPPEGGFTKLYA